MIFFSFTCSLSWKNVITWSAWPTYIIFVFFVSSFNHSGINAGFFREYINPPSTKQYYISYYTSSLYFLVEFINLITYPYWILWPRYNCSHVFHPQLPQVCAWNIQYFCGWYHHLWLFYPWHRTRLTRSIESVCFVLSSIYGNVELVF